MTFTNKQLRKQLKDALADQKGVITSKMAANQALSAKEQKFLKNALADQKGDVTEKFGLAIGTGEGAATANLNLTADIILTSVALGTARNTTTFTLQVLAAAANPTNTILAAFAGTAAAITCTITPNNGTNNGATPVNLTTANLVELINTGAVVGKTVTVTDASSRRVLQTATGGGVTNLADGGEGDGVVATFSGGDNVTLTASDEEFLQNALADQSGQLTAKLAAGTDFSS